MLNLIRHMPAVRACLPAVRACLPGAGGVHAKNTKRFVIVITMLTTWIGLSVSAERIWWDGSRESITVPLPGKLLSDNPGYWGPQVFTGVRYVYEGRQPANPPDRLDGREGTFGNRLLDGRARGDWHIPVGIEGRPPVLTVVFDFQRPCRFAEVHLSTRSRQVAITVEVREDTQAPWRTVYNLPRDACPDRMFHRFPLAPPADGRYLRLRLEAEGLSTYLEEVWVWGEAEVSAAYPEHIVPRVVPPDQPEDGPAIFHSVPGIAATGFTMDQYAAWQAQIGDAARALAVWSRLPVPEGELDLDRPVLPEAESLHPRLTLTLARNERENILLALTSTGRDALAALDLEPVVFEAVTEGGAPSRSEGIRAVFHAGGALPTRREGGDIRIRPFFPADNLPGPAFLRRYLANPESLVDFPRLHLASGESAILLLSVATDQAEPGTYRARIGYNGGEPLTLTVEVLDVTLPMPVAWVRSYSTITPQRPFTTRDRMQREVAYKQTMGITVWQGFPMPGSASALAAFGEPHPFYHVMGLPREYVHRGYAGAIEPSELNETDREQIQQHVLALVDQARALGLDYDQWFVELWDEPGLGNTAIFGALAKIIRATDPRVRIYMNPLFWVEGRGWVDESSVLDLLTPFYNALIDLSVPPQGLDDPANRPELFRQLFDHPRWVRAYYTHPFTVGERRGRGMPWRAFARSWNGWAYYSYFPDFYHDPWDITTWTRLRSFNYQMVFPGPSGAIPTLLSESAREGWEDLRLLTLLREMGSEAVLADLLHRYRDGEPMPDLRLRALRAAAGRIDAATP